MRIWNPTIWNQETFEIRVLSLENPTQKVFQFLSGFQMVFYKMVAISNGWAGIPGGYVKTIKTAFLIKKQRFWEENLLSQKQRFSEEYCQEKTMFLLIAMLRNKTNSIFNKNTIFCFLTYPQISDPIQNPDPTSFRPFIIQTIPNFQIFFEKYFLNLF